MDDQMLSVIVDNAMTYGVRILGAILLWIVGRWLINYALKLAGKAMSTRHLEQTISSYVQNALGVVLNIALIVAILGYFGVETTTFAALLAAAGFAIGTAWSGLLANFAAGVFLVVLKPFAVGDFVQVGGQVGTVKEIGLFVTTVDTMDNIKTIIGNNKIFSETIQNFSANPYRRVDLVAQLNHTVNPVEAKKKLEEVLANIPNVESTPAPDVHILEFNLAGPVLCVRPYCHNDHYWDVYFATNMAIRETFGDAGYPVPETHYHINKTA